MSNNPNMERVRWNIAKKLAYQTLGCDEPNCEYNNEDGVWAQVIKDGFLGEYLEKADAILALPKLRVEADNQETPDNPYPDGYTNLQTRQRIGYQQAQQDMLQAGFVKVEKK